MALAQARQVHVAAVRALARSRRDADFNIARSRERWRIAGETVSHDDYVASEKLVFLLMLVAAVGMQVDDLQPLMEVSGPWTHLGQGVGLELVHRALDESGSDGDQGCPRPDEHHPECDEAAPQPAPLFPGHDADASRGLVVRPGPARGSAESHA